MIRKDLKRRVRELCRDLNGTGDGRDIQAAVDQEIDTILKRSSFSLDRAADSYEAPKLLLAAAFHRLADCLLLPEDKSKAVKLSKS